MEKGINPTKYQSKLSANPQMSGDIFSRNVNICKKISGVTTNDIVEGSGLTIEAVKAVLYYENKNYNAATVAALAKYFKVTMDELYGAESMNAATKDGLQTLRLMDSSYHDFFRWLIKYAYNFMHREKVKNKAVALLSPHCNKEHGNLSIRLRDLNETIDISSCDPAIRSKVLLAVKIPCEHYMPLYFRNDILLIANDRVPFPEEVCVVELDGFLWFAYCRDEIIDGEKKAALYGVTDQKFRYFVEDVDQVVGYVAGVFDNKVL